MRLTMMVAALAALGALGSCSPDASPPRPPEKPPAERPAPKAEAPKADMPKKYPVSMSDEEWKKKLTPEQYHVCREKGTERPFGEAYEATERQGKGLYVCSACENPLFKSETKFHSGTGWPSFFAPAKKEGVEEIRDASHGMERVEVVCSQCGAHLGHVFTDGPRPTGLRYCMNSVSLKFVEEKKEK